MTIYNRAGLLQLKAKIKALSFERREIKNQIRKLGKANSKIHKAIDSANEDKLRDWMDRNNEIASHIRHHGSAQARWHHLAYGLLREIPYRKMERDTEHTKHTRRFLAEKLHEIIQSYAGYGTRREWTLDKIIEWLE